MSLIQFNPQDFWKYLGTSWEKFEDKELIEQIWLAFSQTTGKLTDNLFSLQQSRVMDVLPPTIVDGPDTRLLIFAGKNKNVVLPVQNETGFSFQFNTLNWVYSIPQIELTHTGDIFLENVNYEIVNNRTVKWITSIPAFDPRFTVNSLNLYLPEIKRVNPILMEVWAKAVDFRLKYLYDYITYQEDTSAETQYRHLKYFLWAIAYKRMQSPNIKDMGDLFGIVRGFPFAYNAGMLTSELDGAQYRVTIGEDEYLFPEGVEPLDDGPVKKFDIIAKGLELIGYAQDPNFISSLVNIEFTEEFVIPPFE